MMRFTEDFLIGIPEIDGSIRSSLAISEQAR